ncbi:MAG: uracil-DNA glycosylase family protein [Acidimicrobiales bacterium]
MAHPGAGVREGDAREELERLRDEARGCMRCDLADGRTQVVFGVGSPSADLMFVGEGPGRDEDLQGEPFVGRSGKLLDLLMRQEIGVERDECYIANVVMCLTADGLVQLGDGSWEHIGALVRRRYGGTVRSVDACGRIVERRVVGWHASPLGSRRIFRLTYRGAGGIGAAHSAVDATGDHRVLTEQGWTSVERLGPGARIATGHGLSPVARDVLVGSLLAGGCVRVSDAGVEIVQRPGGHGYARFKASLLAELGAFVEPGAQMKAASGEGLAEAGLGRASTVVRLPARSTGALQTLVEDFCGALGSRVPDWVAGELTPRALAVWVCDGGRRRAGGSRYPVTDISTCAWDVHDLDVLVASLRRLGLPGEVTRGRVEFEPLVARRLARTIAPYVPDPMRHTLPADIASALPFTPGLFDDRLPVTHYDEAIVEALHCDSPGSTVYCIDVEGTHNFVTAGGVVHNCRPPGNRDPLPAEIDACRPYLERQIELVAPKVVVTLGNFATKTLLETSEGIRRVRGRAYPFRGVHLVPTYHPAAALRGGGVVVAEMRADFVRAKSLLRGSR